MILNNSVEYKATIVGGLDSQEFTFKQSSKAYSILSSKLYANKIQSIVRELSCNAYDSHVAAGCPTKQFQVKLPTALDPTFSVKDFGVGLSHESVMKIYPTFFESTKTESNDFTGALGLGSKSPFAYTTNFSITAIKDGKKGLYSAFINDNGIPSVVNLFLEDTTEENGVEISLPVESDDFGDFEKACINVFSVFSTVPEFNIDISDKIKNRNANWITISDDIQVNYPHHSYFRDGGTASIIMANVEYPIDFSNLKELTPAQSDFVGYHINIRFNVPNGAVDFQPSREGLEYTAKTKKLILEKVNKLIEMSSEYVLDLVKDLPENKWERFLAINNVYKNGDTTSLIVSKVIDSEVNDKVNEIFFEFNNQLRRFNVFKGEFLKHNVTISAYTRYDYNNQIKYIHHHNHSYDTFDRTIDDYVKYYAFQRHDFFTNNLVKSVFVIDDKKKISKNTLLQNKEMFNYDTIFVLRQNDIDKPANYEKALELLQHPPKEMVIDIGQVELSKPLPVSMKDKVRATPNLFGKGKQAEAFVNDTTKVYYYHPTYNNEIDSVYFDITSETDEAQANRRKIIKGFSINNVGNILKKVKELTKSDIVISEIYGVGRSDIDKVKKLPNWINVEDILIKCLKSKLSKELTDAILDASVFNKYSNSKFKHRECIEQLSQLPDDIKLMSEIINKKEINFYENIVGYYYLQYAELYDPKVTWALHKKIKNVFKTVDEVLTKYKLFSTMVQNYFKFEEIKHYIDLVNNQKS
jgi:hypothetical protein